MGTAIRQVFRRSWNQTFLRFLGIVLGVEVLTFSIAWLSLDINIKTWIREKTTRATSISTQVASEHDWSWFARIPLKDGAPIPDRYRREIEDTSHKYFFQKTGSIYLVRIAHGEAFEIDSGDNQVSDTGKANEWELRAYDLRKTTYTAEPFSDDYGTYLEAYAPIVSKDGLIGLVAAEFDEAPLSEFQGIVKRTFLYSVLPAILLSLTISYIVANKFVEPLQILQDMQSVKERGLMQADGEAPWGLTGRQLEVFESLAEGLSNPEIASKLCIEPDTVKTHMRAIFKKSGLERWQLVIAARERRSLIETTATKSA